MKLIFHRKFYGLRPVWNVLRGASLWLIWILRNKIVFVEEQWPMANFCKALMDALLDAN